MPTAQLYGAQAARQKALVGGMQQGQSLSPETKAKMHAQAQDFESFYIYQFLELVTPPEDKNSVMNGGPGEEMFHHQLNEEMGKTIAQRGGFGVADTVYAELVRQQEAHNAAMARANQANQYQ